MSRAGLTALIAQVARPGLHFGVARIGEAVELFPAEEPLVARAVPARRAEFLAGRLAARRALARMGRAGTAIPARADRSPVWPEGISGSISHAGHLAVAVVADARRIPVLGIDIEENTPLPEDLIPEICRPEELAGQPHPATLARCLFSAKEALYKAQYPRSRTVFGFHALRVDLAAGRATLPDHPETASLTAAQRTPLGLTQLRDAQLILSLGHNQDMDLPKG